MAFRDEDNILDQTYVEQLCSDYYNGDLKVIKIKHILGKPQKKSYFLSGRATKRGGGGLNGCATKIKRTFF